MCSPGVLSDLVLLLSARKAILTERPTDLSRSLEFLHHDYEPSMYWWEMVETSKKARYLHFPRPDPTATAGCQHTSAHLSALADVPCWLLRAHLPGLLGTAHHRFRLLNRSSPLHVDRRAVPMPCPRQVQLALQLLARNGLVF